MNCLRPILFLCAVRRQSQRHEPVHRLGKRHKDCVQLGLRHSAEGTALSCICRHMESTVDVQDPVNPFAVSECEGLPGPQVNKTCLARASWPSRDCRDLAVLRWIMVGGGGFSSLCQGSGAESHHDHVLGPVVARHRRRHVPAGTPGLAVQTRESSKALGPRHCVISLQAQLDVCPRARFLMCKDHATRVVGSHTFPHLIATPSMGLLGSLNQQILGSGRVLCRAAGVASLGTRQSSNCGFGGADQRQQPLPLP